ncbi:MAG: bifunctional glutamate N-acetyltransferase/amino-acid acetyltransferase ArgJ [Desulfobacterales bacterium]
MKDEATTCPGFQFSGCVSGLKKNREIDLGIIFSEKEAKTAGVFTRNRVQAACVILDRDRIKTGRGRAIIVNSGNANCCTGPQGMMDAMAVTRFVASGLNIQEELVFNASTGVIGEPLPIGKIEKAVPGLIDSLSGAGLPDFAAAIMTTDTFPKISTRKGEIEGKTFTVTGVAKGSGMIKPDMATMLCFVCTDIEIKPAVLQASLAEAVEGSFNRITVDGDTSTNDMAIIMANGVSGVRADNRDSEKVFQKVLEQVLNELARMIVKDGEGATKLVEVKVMGAVSDTDARRIADTVAGSNLVKTALFGEDANWGRIIAAAGRSGVEIDSEKIDIFFNDVQMVKNGAGCGPDAESEAGKILKMPEFEIRIDLNNGNGSSSVLTCDFSVDYVKINADYRS